jgi:uncharacterized membrane protein YozB (DUF420 family)
VGANGCAGVGKAASAGCDKATPGGCQNDLMHTLRNVDAVFYLVTTITENLKFYSGSHSWHGRQAGICLCGYTLLILTLINQHVALALINNALALVFFMLSLHGCRDRFRDFRIYLATRS